MKRLFGFIPYPARPSESKDRALPHGHSGRQGKILPFQRPIRARKLNRLSDLKIGENAILVALDLPDAIQNHLMHMGFVPAAHVTMLRHAPAGDPTVYGVDGMEIALRHETASAIRVREAAQEDDQNLEFYKAAQ